MWREKLTRIRNPQISRGKSIINKPIRKYKFQIPTLRNSNSVGLGGIKEPLFLTNTPDDAEPGGPQAKLQKILGHLESGGDPSLLKSSLHYFRLADAKFSKS